MRKRDTARDFRRAAWMVTFENALVAQAPAFAGHVPWDAAAFHFNQGTNPVLAASEQPRGLAWPHETRKP